MLKVPLNGPIPNGSGGQRFLELSRANLPEDANLLVFTLQREKVSIGFWRQIAVNKFS